jgi:hypothetical protein
VTSVDITCDIIVADPALARVLATRTPIGWLLPTLRAREAARLPHEIQCLLLRIGIVGTVIHEAWLQALAGQEPEARKYCLIVASGECSLSETAPVTWVDVDTLHDSRPAFPSQLRCLNACLTRLLTPTAAYDTLTAPDQAACWIDDVLREHGRVRLGPARVIGSARDYRVEELRTSDGSVFFKGGDAGVAEEAGLTRLVAEHAPGCVAASLGFDAARSWWLTEAVAGSSLQVRANRALVTNVVTTYASIQCKLAFDPRLEQAIPTKIDVTDLRAAVSAALAHAEANQTLRTAVARTCDAVGDVWESCGPMPVTWIHTDLAPANIFACDDRIAFIDLNRPVRGLAVLPLWRFLNAMKGQDIITTADIEACCDAYDAPWRAAGVDGHARLWPYLRQLGVMLRIWVCDDMLRALRVFEPDTAAETIQRELRVRLVESLAADR